MEHDSVIEKYEWLVIANAKRYSNRGVDFDDLKQEGYIGLLKAYNKFNPKKGVRFETHATWWIRAEIRAAVANHSRTIRIPRGIQEKLSKSSKQDAFEPIEYAVQENMKQKDCECQDLRGLENSPGKDDVFKTTYTALLVEKILSFFDNLKIMEKIVLRHRYDVWGDKPKSFRALGSLLEISPQRAQRIEQEAFRKLRGKLEITESAHICR